MSATVAQRKIFRAIDRVFPGRTEAPAKLPALRYDAATRTDKVVDAQRPYIPPVVIQGRTLGQADPAKTPRENRREYFEALRVWAAAGSPPHPVFSPAEWRAVAYDPDTHLAFPRAALAPEPSWCPRCRTTSPGSVCTVCTPARAHAPGCARRVSLAAGHGRVAACDCR